jgi:hypothetical protein
MAVDCRPLNGESRPVPNLLSSSGPRDGVRKHSASCNLRRIASARQEAVASRKCRRRNGRGVMTCMPHTGSG